MFQIARHYNVFVEEAKCVNMCIQVETILPFQYRSKSYIKIESLCENFGINGHLSVKNKYSWEIAGEQLLHVYRWT